MKIRTLITLLLVVMAGQYGLFAQNSYNGFQVEGTAVNASSSNSPSSGPFYHLIILDRTRSPNADIGGIDSNSVVYKVKHRSNGYLLALYTGSWTLTHPQNSHIIVDLATDRKSTIREFVNSPEFKNYFSARVILNDLQRILKSNL
ncbi:hypothetical protein ACYULU_10110 [Breznakiellaceae bacterium SP9]